MPAPDKDKKTVTKKKKATQDDSQATAFEKSGALEETQETETQSTDVVMALDSQEETQPNEDPSQVPTEVDGVSHQAMLS